MRGDKPLTYTQKEIDSKINKLEAQLEGYLLIRKDTNQKVMHCRKQIEQWRDMDLSQIKAF